MKIAIVGAGVAGLTAAHRLHPTHDVTVFEAGDHAGGHTNTIDIEHDGRTWAVDTGFIVCNDRTYPNFLALLADLGVATQPTHMGFSVSADAEDFEYTGTPRGLFAQRRNLARPAFLRMVGELVRFNGDLQRLLASGDEGPSLAAMLADGGYSRFFVDRLIVPQVSAVWSADPAAMDRFPARFLAEFFANHGMLSLRNRPQWLTVRGGSRTYVDAIIARLGGERVRLCTPVTSIARDEDGVTVTPQGGAPERFDEVVLACHSDQALALLADPSDAERDVLGAIAYQRNEAVLHTDSSLLPRRPAVRQAWNAHLLAEPKDRTTVTYWMNHLQHLDPGVDFCVTLNLTERIDPAKVLRVIDYAHPVFTAEAVAAQDRHGEISGVRRTHYCGAYWRWGFHEDGVWSALRAVDGIGAAARREAVAA
ncbi:MAG: FAD-dependent oxidoreductase [Solirubrobacteraceae bacterium]|nr:FAD-dependent oxidoreductase [Solirubrobacteraceae bacterium]